MERQSPQVSTVELEVELEPALMATVNIPTFRLPLSQPTPPGILLALVSPCSSIRNFKATNLERPVD